MNPTICLIVLLAVFGASLSQRINPQLVIPGYTCDRKQPFSCQVEDSRCNAANQCQCLFSFFPDGGKEYKECNFKQCYSDETCGDIYGPNVVCDLNTNHCTCATGWSVEDSTQECILKV